MRTERHTFFEAEGSVMLHELAGGDLPEQCGGPGRRPWAQAVGDVGGRLGSSIRRSGEPVVVEAATDRVPLPHEPPPVLQVEACPLEPPSDGACLGGQLAELGLRLGNCSRQPLGLAPRGLDLLAVPTPVERPIVLSNPTDGTA